MTQTTRDRTEQLAWLAVMAAFGLAAVIGGLAYGLEKEERVGPGVMPFVAGVLILAPLLVQLVRRLRTPVDDAPRFAPDETPADAPVDALADVPADAPVDAPAGAQPAAPAPVPHVGLIFALIAGTVVLSWLIGLLLSVSLLVGVLFWLNERHRPVTALLAAVVAGLFGWLVFVTLLDVPLPRGLLDLI